MTAADRLTPADLVERLRWFSSRKSPSVPVALLDEAADEIERLQAARCHNCLDHDPESCPVCN